MCPRSEYVEQVTEVPDKRHAYDGKDQNGHQELDEHRPFETQYIERSAETLSDELVWSVVCG